MSNSSLAGRVIVATPSLIVNLNATQYVAELDFVAANRQRHLPDPQRGVTTRVCDLLWPMDARPRSLRYAGRGFSPLGLEENAVSPGTRCP